MDTDSHGTKDFVNAADLRVSTNTNAIIDGKMATANGFIFNCEIRNPVQNGVIYFLLLPEANPRPTMDQIVNCHPGSCCGPISQNQCSDTQIYCSLTPDACNQHC